MSQTEQKISDRHGVSYRVEVERAVLWTFYIWDRDDVVGHVYCAEQPPVLKINDLVLRDDVPLPETFSASLWRKIRKLPEPLRTYRERGIGTSILSLIESLAISAGFDRIEGWISKVDTGRNPDLPNWYRRRGFEVVMESGNIGQQAATIRRDLIKPLK